MRVGMHEMHALRVRGFFHDNDNGRRNRVGYGGIVKNSQELTFAFIFRIMLYCYYRLIIGRF